MLGIYFILKNSYPFENLVLLVYIYFWGDFLRAGGLAVPRFFINRNLGGFYFDFWALF